MKKIFIIAFTLFAFNSYSQEWELIEERDSQTYHIRMNSVNTAWIKVTNVSEYDKLLGDGFEKVLILYRFNCYNTQLGQLAWTEYDWKGEVYRSAQFEAYEVKMEYAVPDSMGEIFFKAFCDRTKD